MITDFLKVLKTDFQRKHLKIALDVICKFQYTVIEDEWVNLERLEEFLRHLVYAKPLKQDTLNYIKDNESENSEG